jgi:hypothetical protein
MSLIVDTSDEDSDDKEEHIDRLWFQATLYSSLETTRYLFHNEIHRSDVRRGGDPA